MIALLESGQSFTNLFVFIFQDNNLGLVKQVVSSIYKRNIQRLTQTYLTLSLQDIATTVQLNSPKEAEMYVLQMVNTNLDNFLLFPFYFVFWFLVVVGHLYLC